MTHTPVRTVTIYRERYTVEDDGNGGSMSVTTDTDTDVHVCDGYRSPDYVETPAREAVGILRSAYLSYGADGGDWFGQCEPSTVDYGTGEQERVTGHLAGFTAAEERVIIRMMEWLDRRDAARVAEYLAR